MIRKSVEPNMVTYFHTVGRKNGTPVAGTFEITAQCNFNCPMCYVHMSEEEIRICTHQTMLFRKYYDLIAFGDYYRLSDPFSNTRYTAWEHVAKDGSAALITVIIMDSYPSDAQLYICPKGILPDAIYEIDNVGELHGNTLMQLGLPIPLNSKQYESIQFYLRKI